MLYATLFVSCVCFHCRTARRLADCPFPLLRIDVMEPLQMRAALLARTEASCARASSRNRDAGGLETKPISTTSTVQLQRLVEIITVDLLRLPCRRSSWFDSLPIPGGIQSARPSADTSSRQPHCHASASRCRMSKSRPAISDKIM